MDGQLRKVTYGVKSEGGKYVHHPGRGSPYRFWSSNQSAIPESKVATRMLCSSVRCGELLSASSLCFSFEITTFELFESQLSRRLDRSESSRGAELLQVTGRGNRMIRTAFSGSLLALATTNLQSYTQGSFMQVS